MGSDILLAYAMRFVGVPYKWGGDDPLLGIDCSGLVLELLKSQGLVPKSFDTTAQGLYKKYESVKVFKASFGALVFFGADTSKITHVGFALDNKVMIEAGGGDSTTVNLLAAAEKNAFVKIRPILSRSDLVGIVRPRYYWEET
jgi:cell wall-associated NlpC family hydrolase